MTEIDTYPHSNGGRLPYGKTYGGTFLRGYGREKTVIFEDATHAIETAKADGFLVASVYSPYEKDAVRVRTLSDVHIDAFDNMEAFWQFAEKL